MAPRNPDKKGQGSIPFFWPTSVEGNINVKIQPQVMCSVYWEYKIDISTRGKFEVICLV